MKNKLATGLLGIMLIALVSSCTNEDIPPTKNDAQISETFSLIIKFDGKTYNVPCAMQNDSLIYLDENFNALYKNEISPISPLTMLTYKDDNGNDVVEYYRSEKELAKQKNISYFIGDNVNLDVMSRADQTMPQPTAGRAILYDDTGFKDRTIVLDIDFDRYPSIGRLKDYHNFNDKTSAIRVFNFINPSKNYKPSYGVPSSPFDQGVSGSQLRTCLIGYEDSGFKGNILYCVASYSSTQDINRPETASHQDYKLKRIGWNDKISSVVFRIINISLINSGTITPHNPI